MGDPKARDAVRRLLPYICTRMERTNVVSKDLNRIFHTIKASQDVVLTDRHLKELGIKLSSFNLETDTTDGRTATFFRPLSKGELPTIDWNNLDLWEWYEGLGEEPARVDHNLYSVWHQVWAGWFLNDVKMTWTGCEEIPVGGGAEFPPRNPYQWVAHHETQAKSLTIPHFMVKVTHHAEPDERISRGEVLPITSYMEWRLRLTHYVQHFYMPILVVSFFRSKARILQAYHDGKQLHISMSKFYDFKEDNHTNYELFARWLHSKPCGDTSAPINIVGEKLDDRSVKKLESHLKQLLKVK
ncbi:hypothetical protein BDW59DRAFT_20365 [Aspergillus cavernicola]|uniref:Uncharacterized protein n=1 Tax=Aspergillus cavernicola TaxID=176166 RepID=A0ABR4HHP9_9EURO